MNVSNRRACHRVREPADVLDILVRQYEYVGVGSSNFKNLVFALMEEASSWTSIACVSSYLNTQNEDNGL